MNDLKTAIKQLTISRVDANKSETQLYLKMCEDINKAVDDTAGNSTLTDENNIKAVLSVYKEIQTNIETNPLALELVNHNSVKGMDIYKDLKSLEVLLGSALAHVDKSLAQYIDVYNRLFKYCTGSLKNLVAYSEIGTTRKPFIFEVVNIIMIHYASLLVQKLIIFTSEESTISFSNKFSNDKAFMAVYGIALDVLTDMPELVRLSGKNSVQKLKKDIKAIMKEELNMEETMLYNVMGLENVSQKQAENMLVVGNIMDNRAFIILNIMHEYVVEFRENINTLANDVTSQRGLKYLDILKNIVMDPNSVKSPTTISALSEIKMATLNALSEYSRGIKVVQLPKLIVTADSRIIPEENINSIPERESQIPEEKEDNEGAINDIIDGAEETPEETPEKKEKKPTPDVGVPTPKKKKEKEEPEEIIEDETTDEGEPEEKDKKPDKKPDKKEKKKKRTKSPFDELAGDKEADDTK